MSSSTTFDPGIRLLPADLRMDARRLYSVLRTIDDLVDDGDPRAAARVEAIERWARGAGTDVRSPDSPDADSPDADSPDADSPGAATPEVNTLADLASRHPLPAVAVLEFCAGMRHDLDGAKIDTEDELETYCQGAGGSVGVILTAMFGSSDPGCARLMACLGRAFQRTNILRDIDEDAAHGRLYLSRTTIEQFGEPVPGAREALLRDQIARADALYEEGLAAIPLLQRGGRAMAVSTALYREILRQIERDGYGRRPGRAVVSRWRTHLVVSRHKRGTSRS